MLMIQFLLPHALHGAEAMQKIRVGLPSLALSYMPLYVTQEKGFLTWIRNNRLDTANMIADKFKITPTEANGTYETLLSMLNKDGRLPLKVVHGYLDILRRERPIPADVDPQKFLDFSMLPGGK